MANFSDKNESQSVIGLNDSQVKESRGRHGPNILTPAAKNPWWMDYLEKFEDPVIRILLVAAFIAIIAGFFQCAADFVARATARQNYLPALWSDHP